MIALRVGVAVWLAALAAPPGAVADSARRVTKDGRAGRVLDTAQTPVPVWWLPGGTPRPNTPFRAVLVVPAGGWARGDTATVRLVGVGDGTAAFVPLDRACPAAPAAGTTGAPAAAGDTTLVGIAAEGALLGVCATTPNATRLGAVVRTRGLGGVATRFVASDAVTVAEPGPLSPVWTIMLTALVGAATALAGSLAAQRHAARIEADRMREARAEARRDQSADAMRRVITQIDGELADDRTRLDSLAAAGNHGALVTAGYTLLRDGAITEYLGAERGAGYVTALRGRYLQIGRYNAAVNAWQTAGRDGAPPADVASARAEADRQRDALQSALRTSVTP